MCRWVLVLLAACGGTSVANEYRIAITAPAVDAGAPADGATVDPDPDPPDPDPPADAGLDAPRDSWTRDTGTPDTYTADAPAPADAGLVGRCGLGANWTPVYGVTCGPVPVYSDPGIDRIEWQVVAGPLQPYSQCNGPCTFGHACRVRRTGQTSWETGVCQ